ncbi:ubiquinol-cytochrome c reductase complex assembly factor 1 isoform X1 [Haemaphysalis longicornis]
MFLRSTIPLLSRGLRSSGSRYVLLVNASSRVHTQSHCKSPVRPLAVVPVGSRWDRLKSFMRWQFVIQDKTKEGGVYVYESCVDKVDFRAFFTYLNLPDTFLSWFLITELHVWMCITRAMAEIDTRTALCLQHELVRNLWSDTETRMGKIAYMPGKIKRECLRDLSDHFNAMLLLYDEALQGDDKALAGALWRVLLLCEGRDPRVLETLVHYVRKQIHMLDKMTLEDFLRERSITWTPLMDCVGRRLQ